uniref:Uncharacterized protein n=1 Tax=Schlesneria paludicola TaxID=360056 RepID=A0A7C4LNH6_9PLAN
MTAPEPPLFAVREPRTLRDLLVDPHPLVVSTQNNRETVRLQIENGPAAPLTLTVVSNQPWLRPLQSRLELPTGGLVNLEAAITAEGTDEFALLELQWQEDGQLWAEPILIQRQFVPQELRAGPPRESAGSEGIENDRSESGLPDWMRDL